MKNANGEQELRRSGYLSAGCSHYSGRSFSKYPREFKVVVRSVMTSSPSAALTSAQTSEFCPWPENSISVHVTNTIEKVISFGGVPTCTIMLFESGLVMSLTKYELLFKNLFHSKFAVQVWNVRRRVYCVQQYWTNRCYQCKALRAWQEHCLLSLSFSSLSLSLSLSLSNVSYISSPLSCFTQFLSVVKICL